MTGLILLIATLLSGVAAGSIHRDQVDAHSPVAGIHQERLVLGEPDAPVELIEFGDLQCPFCREWSEDKLPGLIRGPVAMGEAKIRFENFDIIGPQSAVASAAALAAAEQGHGWQFLEAFFRHQGAENSGYVTPAFLDRIATLAGVPDLARFRRDRESARLRDEAHASTRRAFKLGFTGTPSFAIRGPGTHGTKPLGTPSGPAELERAIEEAAGGGSGEFVSAPGSPALSHYAA